MRHLQVGLVDHAALPPEDVEVERPRAVLEDADAAGLRLDPVQLAQEGPRRERRLDQGGGVRVLRLVGRAADRRRPEHVRHEEHGGGGQRVDRVHRGAERLERLAEVRAEADRHVSTHGRRRWVTVTPTASITSGTGAEGFETRTVISSTGNSARIVIATSSASRSSSRYGPPEATS